MMKVAMYYANDDVRIEDMPRPEPGKGELLVKVMASGICGSDVMEWYRKKSAPKVLGHEMSGEVAEVGEGVTGFSQGDRIFVSHHVPCNTCCHCLKGHHTTCDLLRTTNFYPGGFSEYLLVPEINVDRGVFRLPEGMSYEQGTFIEPLGCVARSQRLSGLCPGESVLVMGSGMAGMLHIRLALAMGAGKVFATDMSEYRLQLARKSGAHSIKATEDVEKAVRALNGGRLADKIMVCTGAYQAAMQAFGLVERGGTVMFFAVPKPDQDVGIPLNSLWKNEVKVMTSYAASPRDIEDSMKMIDSGRVKLDDLITHSLPLDKAGEGFRLVSDARESMKVILRPHG